MSSAFAVEASSRYLAHIRAAWDERFTDDKLADQDIVLTLPASFDEIARELTVQAAAKAGLPRVVLIEEPQAAFYAWIYKHQEPLGATGFAGAEDPGLRHRRRDDRLHADSRSPRRGGKIQFHRVAVGEHLLLGGDNMDLALAQHLESKLVALPAKLDQRQWESCCDSAGK